MRKNLWLLLASTVVLIAGLVGVTWWNPATESLQVIDPGDEISVARGRALYSAQCAACHGTRLQGQPNWRERLPSGRLPAPPHDPSGHTWHHPDQVLFDIVKNGLVPGRTAPPGYQSDMPAYGAVLSDQDIRDVLAYIKSTWPQSVRAVQEKATLEYARQ
ncbi:MAG: cytochrome c [Alcaligenaceae bacterium]|nr:cytochrome c [Alcaligenaceae bacterium]